MLLVTRVEAPTRPPVSAWNQLILEPAHSRTSSRVITRLAEAPVGAQDATWGVHSPVLSRSYRNIDVFAVSVSA